jgi:hypothetical protein
MLRMFMFVLEASTQVSELAAMLSSTTNELAKLHQITSRKYRNITHFSCVLRFSRCLIGPQQIYLPVLVEQKVTTRIRLSFPFDFAEASHLNVMAPLCAVVALKASHK